MMDEFESVEIALEGRHIFARKLGRGPPLLLLHGFPQTHVMWRDVARPLARLFTVVCADLPGYGRSGGRKPERDHASQSKRAMADDLVALMERLGFSRFGLAGHDRGGRVAYRMALDHPDWVERVAVLDVLPIEAVWDRADAQLVLGFWPFSLLAQPTPLPERVLTSAAEAIVDHALTEWGTPRDVFPDDVRAAYVESLRDPVRAHAICEEYRAAATIDREHDRADHVAARRIACPLLALWSAHGPLGSWYAEDGGPLGIWRAWADDVRGRPVDGGHFFPEERPEQTAEMLSNFFNPGSPKRRENRDPARQSDGRMRSQTTRP